MILLASIRQWLVKYDVGPILGKKRFQYLEAVHIVFFVLHVDAHGGYVDAGGIRDSHRVKYVCLNERISWVAKGPV